MYCVNCGNKLNEETAFCPLCGAKVEQSESSKDNITDKVSNNTSNNTTSNVTDNLTDNTTANSTESANKKRFRNKKMLILGTISLAMVITVISIFFINRSTTDNAINTFLDNISYDVNHLVGSDMNSTEDISTYTVKILADNPTQRQTDAIINVLRKRLENYSKNADVKLWHSNLIIIKVPKSDNIDLDIIKDNISSGKLEFKDTSGKILMVNSDVQSAKLLMDKNTKAYLVGIHFTEEGSKKLSNITHDYLGKELDIYYEDNLIQAATVESVISSGEAVISGFDEKLDAERIICSINSGCLPTELEVEEIISAD